MKKDSIRIKKWDWLLIIGACLAPMTGLRIWKIGPAEILCFIWGLRYLPKRKYRLNDLSRFFILFIGTMFIGSIICITIAPDELSRADWATWIFLAFIALALYEGLSHNSLEYNEKTFFIISISSVAWYLALFFYSRLISTNFLGAPLWYNRVRYTGGGTNPHQLAVLMCGIFFSLARYFLREKNRFVCLLGIVTAGFLVFQTASSTGLLSIFLGCLVLIILLTLYRMRSKRTKAIVIVVELFVGALIIGIGYPIIYRYTYNWIANDPNGLGRFYIFSSIKGTFLKSPLFGLGPGVHARDPVGLKEFHNTYLEILAATGIIGSVGFTSFTIKSLKKLTSDALLIPIIVSIYSYGLAGFAMRRLAYWIVFIFSIIISEQVLERKEDKELVNIYAEKT